MRHSALLLHVALVGCAAAKPRVIDNAAPQGPDPHASREALVAATFAALRGDGDAAIALRPPGDLVACRDSDLRRRLPGVTPPDRIRAAAARAEGAAITVLAIEDVGRATVTAGAAIAGSIDCRATQPTIVELVSVRIAIDRERWPVPLQLLEIDHRWYLDWVDRELGHDDVDGLRELASLMCACTTRACGAAIEQRRAAKARAEARLAALGAAPGPSRDPDVVAHRERAQRRYDACRRRAASI